MRRLMISQLWRPLAISVLALGLALGSTSRIVHADVSQTDTSSMPTEAPSTGPEIQAPARHHHHHGQTSSSPAPSPTPIPTPTPVAYGNFGGTWELQLQIGHATEYSHFFFANGTTSFAGRWMRSGALVPILGSIDNDRFSITGTDAHGSFQMTGYQENDADLVGIFTQGAAKIPFTATHQGLVTSSHHHHRRHRELPDIIVTPSPLPTLH